MNVQDYKCAIVQYACDDCMIGDNFTFIFDFNKGDYYKTEEGLCSHLTLTFNLSLSNSLFNCFVIIKCKDCKNEENKTIIDNNCADMMNSVHYKCKCGKGDLNIGVLLESEILDLGQNGEEEDVQNIEKQSQINNNYNNNSNEIEPLNNTNQMNNIKLNDNNQNNNNFNDNNQNNNNIIN